MSMVEEEPSHEIYASLIGKDPSKMCPSFSPSSSSSSVAITTTARRSMDIRRGQSSAIIPPEPDQPDIHNTGTKDETDNSLSTASTCASTKTANKSTFANFYRRALQSYSSTSTSTSASTSAPPPAPLLSQLSLNKSNKGFQMLTKMGFSEKDGGLGKMRQGQLSPVKTILKLDKKGLGRGPKHKRVPRVTHRQQTVLASSTNDSNADTEGQKYCKKLSKGERKRRAKNQLTKEQMREKRARMMINSNLPDEYGAYLGLN